MKILVTGGPVHANIDAVKVVTNKFKGGLMAKLAGDIAGQSGVDSVTYLCSRQSKLPSRDYTDGSRTKVEIEHHEGFHDYRDKVCNLAPQYDAVVLGAAVANLIPVALIDNKQQKYRLPLQHKFPSHHYSPEEEFMMTWKIAPRIIDEVKAHMKPGAHLFGFKLLNDVTDEELVSAAFDIILNSGATAVFANDATELERVCMVGKDRSCNALDRHLVAENIAQLTQDRYYRTELTDENRDSIPFKPLLFHRLTEEDFTLTPEGYLLGCVAVRNGDGFLVTGRGKNELETVVQVDKVDHQNLKVYARGGKPSLNTPLLDRLFERFPEVKRIVHFHHCRDDLRVFRWAPPGTVRDAHRPVARSFNIAGHGCYLLQDKDCNIL